RPGQDGFGCRLFGTRRCQARHEGARNPGDDRIRQAIQAEDGGNEALTALAERRIDLHRQPPRGPAREPQQLRLPPCRSHWPMGRLACDDRVVTISDDQAGFARKEALSLTNAGQPGRYRPVETVAILEMSNHFPSPTRSAL